MHKHISIQDLYAHYSKSSYRICTDTRKIENGSIFFALKGDNFNANEYAQKAIDLGCAFAVVDEEKYSDGIKIFLVNDVLTCLQKLANHHRNRLKLPFLGITGSNGKTTTKELVATVLSKKFKTLATIGNLNNHIGVPLTILSIRPEHDFAIIEMGANHQGEINQLCEIAEPDFGMITNIGKAHLEGFGGIEGVKKGKSELYKFIRNKNGKIFINDDDEVLTSLSNDINKIKYGTKNHADCIGKNFNNGQTVCFKFKTNNENKDWNDIALITTHIVGDYNFINCLAAAAIGTYFGLNYDQIKDAIEDYKPNMNRSQLLKTARNSIILDAYNANPNSMKVAVENFANFKADKKMLLLGDMFELGEFSQAEHQDLVDLLKLKEFESVVLVGPHFYDCLNHHFVKFKSIEDCKEFLINEPISQATLLIKGSRGMKMETLVDLL